MELNYNRRFKNEIKNKTEQIERLKTTIKKLTSEKESSSLNKSCFQLKSTDNSNLNSLNRTKTDKDSKKKSNKDLYIDYLIDNSGNKINNSSKRQTTINEKEYKSDKNLEISRINENSSNKKKSDDAKSEDDKITNN